MADTTQYTATGSSYANKGSWANSKKKNPVYVGNNGDNSYSYVGQFVFPMLGDDPDTITKIELAIYRTSSSATYAKDEYYGCSTSLSDYASVLSIGELITISGGAGWKIIDVTALKNETAPFSGQWTLLIGNPNDNNTYCVLAGYGSGNMPYLTVYYDDSSIVHYALSDNTTSECKLYYAKSATELVRCDVLYATGNDSAVKIYGR